MKILIFAGKEVGLHCLKFLLKQFSQDEYHIITCEPGKEALENFLNHTDYTYHSYCPEAIEQLNNMPAGSFDWLLNLWGNHIFSGPLLSIADKSLNIHPSFLPFGRGRDPVVWAIRHEVPAGVSFHQITEDIDAGPIWYQEKVDFTFPCRGQDLYRQVIQRCWQAFTEQWQQLRTTTKKPEIQDENFGGATAVRKDLFNDQKINIDNDRSAKAVILQLLAHDFSPDYTALLEIDGCLYKVRLELEEIK